MRRNPLSPTPLQVWAVEDTSAQLTWGRLPPGTVSASWTDGEGGRVSVDHEGGPGSLEINGLAPRATVTITVTWPGGNGVVEVRTLEPPPGPLLCRIATVSDLHLGSYHWGATKLMLDRSGHPVPFPLRCARAALTEASAWGAELMVVKGDAAHHQRADQFALVGALLDEYPELPMLLLPGNHEVDEVSDHPLPAKVGARGVPYVVDAACVDLAGIRVVVGRTTISGRGRGSIEGTSAAIAELVSEAGGPYLLGLHHQLQPHRFPVHYPLGVPGPQSARLLDRLVHLNPAGFVTSGHTHRNRARRHGPLAITEVAATRDWPGVWAGYAVHEGGIRQVVRRVAHPEAMTWLEYSHRALLGRWESWAQGPLAQRCFTHRWP
jgi:3',5'-cyclic-AMP phosphodiesterase